MDWLSIDYRDEQRRSRSALILGLLMLLTVSSAIWTFTSDVPELAGASWHQRRIIAELGEPSGFVITYLPLGERRRVELVRNEVWQYPEHGQSISFLAGRIVSVDAIEEGRPSTLRAKPWQIGPKTTTEDVARITGRTARPVPEWFAPGLLGDAEVYLADSAVFAIENGLLVYARMDPSVRSQ